MSQREIDEMYSYLLEFTADVLYCAAPYSEDRKGLAAITYNPEFKQNFLLSYRNEQDTVEMPEETRQITTEVWMTFGEVIDYALNQLQKFRLKYYPKQQMKRSLRL